MAENMDIQQVERLEDAPLERQTFFREKMIESRPWGKCDWCGRMSRLWKMHLRNVQHPTSNKNGVILPMELCYACCERELATSTLSRRKSFQDAEVLDMAHDRDRSGDLGEDGREMSEMEAHYYYSCGTIPKGEEAKGIGFIATEDPGQRGKKVIKPGD
jgi:hypothetical protein